jgi:hypothetical protein
MYLLEFNMPVIFDSQTTGPTIYMGSYTVFKDSIIISEEKIRVMPTKLTTTVNKIQSVSNPTNSVIIDEFYQYMRNNDASIHHQNNNLKVIIAFANFLGPNITFYDIQRKEQILAFLNMKVKKPDQDPDKRWITTWNHYLNRIKLFLRWLYNYRGRESDGEIISSEWETPTFAKIKGKKSKLRYSILSLVREQEDDKDFI